MQLVGAVIASSGTRMFMEKKVSSVFDAEVGKTRRLYFEILLYTEQQRWRRQGYSNKSHDIVLFNLFLTTKVFVIEYEMIL